MVCGRSHGLFTKCVETKALVNIRDVDIKKNSCGRTLSQGSEFPKCWYPIMGCSLIVSFFGNTAATSV